MLYRGAARQGTIKNAPYGDEDTNIRRNTRSEHIRTGNPTHCLKLNACLNPELCISDTHTQRHTQRHAHTHTHSVTHSLTRALTHARRQRQPSTQHTKFRFSVRGRACCRAASQFSLTRAVVQPSVFPTPQTSLSNGNTMGI